MNTTHKSFLKVALGIASTLTLGTTLMAQFPNLAQVQLRARAPHAPVAPSAPQVSLVTDWSHKKLVFSAPKDAEQSKRLEQEPRFMQQHQRRAMIAVKSIADIASSGPRVVNTTMPGRLAAEQPMHRDWTAALGPSAGVGNAQFPAKFSFNINATPNCASDFVAYNTNTSSYVAAGSKGGYSASAFDFGFFWSTPTVGSTIVINGTTFTAVYGTAGSLQYSVGTVSNRDNPFQAANNFVNAVNAYNAAHPTTFTFTAQLFFGNGLWLTDTAPGSAGNNVSVSPSDCFPIFGCSDAQNFTWWFPKLFGGFGGGTGTTAASGNIVALNNLYSTCSAGPSTYFAYATSTVSGGSTTSSVSLSEDGSKLAFVESSSTQSFLHILKWKAGAGTISAPVTPATASGSTWSTCTSCQIVIPMGSHSSSNSAPFVDYADDAIYVGDDNGTLYKYNGAFQGTSPAKAWSVTVDSGAKLTSPVYDSVSGNIFVADSKGCVSYVVGGTYSAVAHGCVVTTGGYPIPDPPIVDSNTEMVLVFVGNNGSGNAEIIQTNISLTDPTSLPVGAAGAQMHAGDFDNNYYSGDMGQGHLYYCGKLVTQDMPAIRRITFDAYGNFNGSDPDEIQVGNTLDSECSPLTEVYNGNTAAAPMDLMFFGVTAGGMPSNCYETGSDNPNSSGGCLMSIDVTAGDGVTDAFPTGLAASLGEPGGTSGIVIDNVTSSGSNVYFTPLTVGTTNGNCTGGQGCAVKATQNGLN